MAAHIEAFCREHDLDEEMAGDVRLALDELITNIIKHGYEDEEEHSIDVNLDFSPDSLTIRVEDDGIPFNPLDVETVDVDVPFDESSIGGWGIHLVKQIMDEANYQYVDGRNRLTLKKKRV